MGAVGACALSACLSSSTPSTDNGADGGGSGPTSSGGSNGSNGSSSGGGQSSSGASSSGSPSTSSGGSSDGDGGSTIGAPAGTMLVPLMPDANGYIDPSSNSLGIQGAWYAYGDDWGTNGAPPGNCESMGSHPSSACSQITSPMPAMLVDGGYVASFPQTTPGTMCLSGTAAKVVGGDYSNIFGIGLGLDFDNQGGDKMPYDATTHDVIGFTFHIDGIPTGATVRVEFPEAATNASGDSWAILASTSKDYQADLTTATSDANALKPSFTMTGTQPAFDPTTVQSIQFHIPTNTTAAVTVANLCVSNLQAIVKM
jgi:hypothetical protein